MSISSWSLKQKIVIPVATAAVIIVVALSVFVGKQTYDSASADAQKIIAATSEVEAEKITALFDKTLQLARASAASAMTIRNSPNPDRTLAINTIHELLKRNKFIVGNGQGWEPNAFDGRDKDFTNARGHDASGRFVPYWSRSGDKEELSPLADYDKEGVGDFYQVPKKNKKEWVMPPYLYPIGGVNILMTSAIVPLMEGDRFLGMIGVDIDLKDIQEAVNKIKPYPESEASIVTDELLWVANGNKDVIAKPAEISFDKALLQRAIDTNRYDVFQYVDAKTNTEYMVSINPIFISNDQKPWALILQTPVDVVMAEANTSLRSQLIIVAFGIGLLLALIYFISANVANRISGMTEKMKESVVNVSHAIGQMNSAGQSLSEASSSSAASVEETVASLEELTSMVKLNANNAKQAASLSAASTEAAAEGERDIKSLIQSMSEISSSSKQIQEIIHVIDDIAFQTNLLALNASVEAARAGEQGKGFAVVAEAVRTLALKSADAANNITALIKDSVQKVETGTEQADRNGEALGKILTSIKKVSDLNNEIATASEEQSTGIQQISSAMNQLDQSIQSNAASSEEIAATSQEINSQSAIMNDLVQDINKMVLGEKDQKIHKTSPGF